MTDYNVLISTKDPKSIELFEKIKHTGTEVPYRCPDGRNCPHCKKGPRIEEIAIEDGVTQFVIENGVHVDIENGCSMSNLPFMKDLDVRLLPNDKLARHIYDSQIK